MITLEEARAKIPWHPSHVGDCVGPEGDYFRFNTSLKDPSPQRKNGRKRWFFEGSYSVICEVSDYGEWQKTLRYRPMSPKANEW